MSPSTVERIAPETFEQAKQDAVALRRAAMKKLIDDLWRGMTAPLASVTSHLPVAANANKPCVPYY